MKLFTIPNLITLGNLLCGCLAIVCAFNGNLVWAAYLVGIAAVLDFLDGFVARALKQHSPIGKDLDSLADMVTFGVVPGVVMFQLLRAAFMRDEYMDVMKQALANPGQEFPPLSPPFYLCAIGFLITLFSALRLAKFNNDTRQSDSFIGVPTPANSILICSVPLAFWQLTGLNLNSAEAFVDSYQFHWLGGIMDSSTVAYCNYLMSPWTLIAVTVVMSFLLISEIPLFSLKLKSFGWKGNGIRYSFLAVAVIMLVLLKYIALPLIIVLYILLSIINNLFSRNRAPGTEH